MKILLAFLIFLIEPQEIEKNKDFLDGKPVILSIDKNEMEGGAMATILINSPIENVFDVLKDASKFHLFMPSLEKVEIIEEKEKVQIVRFYVKKAFVSISYALKREIDRENFEIKWINYDDTFQLIRGFWRLKPFDGKTMVIYYTYLKPGFMIPQVIVDYLEEKSIPDMLTAVKNRIEKGYEKKEKKGKKTYEF
jgi:ribosome-associated toxin RatA of RatAB toxin-antitoxin module